ncbi:hypothetical protein TcWFU_002844 [Taenia crassiceps]|uniref:BRCT domain-containing protein n=1 Tax=Taenia crassiceps TaxID=6207 RepID=A0ABR4QD98_9CEST
MRRLQLGIYPVEPRNRKKAGLGNSQPRIYFHAKDIAFLAREPLIETFRKLRVHQKRLKKAREKLDRDKEYRLRMSKPTYTLYHLVRERYPTRSDALRDLTDSLNLIFLFARLPRLTHFHPTLISLCRRFSVEFLHYVIAMRCIRKGSGNEGVDSVQLEDLVELQTIDDSVAAAVGNQIRAQRIKHIFDGKRFFFNREVPKEVLTVIIRSCGGDCSWDATSGPGATYTEDDSGVDYQIVDRPMKDMKSTRSYVQPQWVFDSLNAGRLLPTQDYLPSVSLPPHLSPFATAVTADPRTAMADALKQAAAVSIAPGFGAGSVLYRPPEVDYLAGLVSLAEVRGAAVAAAHIDEAADKQQQDEGGDNLQLEVDEAHVEKDRNKCSKKNKTSKRNAIKALKKGKKAVVKPGHSLNELVVKMAERAEENAQRKLREMMLPKRHKNLYRKMIYAQKTADKDMRQLAERRKSFEKTRPSQRKSK